MSSRGWKPGKSSSAARLHAADFNPTSPISGTSCRESPESATYPRTATHIGSDRRSSTEEPFWVQPSALMRRPVFQIPAVRFSGSGAGLVTSAVTARPGEEEGDHRCGERGSAPVARHKRQRDLDAKAVMPGSSQGCPACTVQREAQRDDASGVRVGFDVAQQVIEAAQMAGSGDACSKHDTPLCVELAQRQGGGGQALRSRATPRPEGFQWTALGA